MTQIGHRIAASRRPGVLGVHSLDHFAVAIPDLKTARRYYGAFGLDVSEHGAALHLRTLGGRQVWGVLTEGPRKSLQHLSFGIFADDVGRFQKHIESRGVPLTDPPPGAASNGLWLRDLDGTAIELRVADKSSPNGKSEAGLYSVAANLRGASVRGAAAMVRPRRMAHVLLFTRDVPATVAFYTSVLGLRLSDEAGGVIAFLHGVHGSDHHMVAFAKSDGPGLHHCSWDVGAVDEIGTGAAQMADSGFAAGWGLGRHVLGSNYFHYVRDPWGGYAEYSCDIDYLSADRDWEGQHHSVENSLYLWGPEPPQDFTFNYEASPEAQLVVRHR